MSMDIIDLLEPVGIKHDQPERSAMTPRSLHLFLQANKKGTAVEQLGQRVQINL